MRFLLSLSIVIPMLAQDAPPPGGAKKGPPQPHKNLKILTDDEVRPAMGAYVAALGVKCTECHVQGNFASDENPKKDVARGMITMVRHINSDTLAGKTQVTCYTCHRGEVMPKTAPEAAAPKAF